MKCAQEHPPIGDDGEVRFIRVPDGYATGDSSGSESEPEVEGMEEEDDGLGGDLPAVPLPTQVEIPDAWRAPVFPGSNMNALSFVLNKVDNLISGSSTNNGSSKDWLLVSQAAPPGYKWGPEDGPKVPIPKSHAEAKRFLGVCPPPPQPPNSVRAAPHGILVTVPILTCYGLHTHS